jgi:hypothetical protein
MVLHVGRRLRRQPLVPREARRLVVPRTFWSRSCLYRHLLLKLMNRTVRKVKALNKVFPVINVVVVMDRVVIVFLEARIIFIFVLCIGKIIFYQGMGHMGLYDEVSLNISIIRFKNLLEFVVNIKCLFPVNGLNIFNNFLNISHFSNKRKIIKNFLIIKILFYIKFF